MSYLCELENMMLQSFLTVFLKFLKSCSKTTKYYFILRLKFTNISNYEHLLMIRNDNFLINELKLLMKKELNSHFAFFVLNIIQTFVVMKCNTYQIKYFI